MLEPWDFSEMFTILADLGLMKPSEKTAKAMTIAWQVASHGIDETRLTNKDAMRAAAAFMKEKWATA